MMGELSNQAARQRTKDIHDVIATDECKGLKIVEEQTANWSRTQGADLMTNWLSAGLEFDAVVSNNDEMAIGAIQALKAAGRSMDSVVIGGVDATQDALAAMAAGDLDVTVFQNAAGQGKGAVDAALKLAKGEKVEKKVYVPFELVTPENCRSTKLRSAPRTDQSRSSVLHIARASGRSAASGRFSRTARTCLWEEKSMTVSPTTMAAVRASGAVPQAEYLLNVEGVRKEFPGVRGAGRCAVPAEARHGACADGRERRRQIDADEDPRRHLSRPTRARSSSRACRSG